MPETAPETLSPIDLQVQDLCWGTRAALLLPQAARELLAWAHANGWPAMTEAQATDLLFEEGRDWKLRPGHPPLPAAQAAAWFREEIAGSRDFVAGLAGPGAPQVRARAEGRINGLRQAWLRLAELGLINLSEEDKVLING